MKTVTKLFGQNNVDITFINVIPSGYGHYKINGSATIEGTRETLKLSVTTSNMPAIDAYKSDDDDKRDEMALNFAEELAYQCEGAIVEWKLELEAKAEETE